MILMKLHYIKKLKKSLYNKTLIIFQIIYYLFFINKILNFLLINLFFINKH